MEAVLEYLRMSQLGKARRLFIQLFFGYGFYAFIFVVLGLVSGLMEAIGINALIPLFSIFTGEAIAGTDFISQAIQAVFALAGIPFTLPAILIFIVVMFFGKALALLGFTYVTVMLQTQYEQDTMTRLFRSTLYSSWPYLLRQKLGYMETLLKVDLYKTSSLLTSFSRMIVITTGLVVYLAVALNISETVTIFTIVSGGIILFTFRPLLFRARRVAAKSTEMNKKIAHHVNEQIIGMKVVKAMGMEDKVTNIAKGFFAQVRDLNIRTSMLQKVTIVFIQPLTVGFIALVVTFAFYETSYSLGALAAIIYLINRIFSQVQETQSILNRVNDAVPYAQSLLAYRNLAERSQEIRSDWGNDPFRFTSTLQFDDVHFSYQENNPILKGVSINIKRGSFVGFVGPSGGGKTTIFDLLLRFLEPDKGGILLDGVPIRNINIEEWRKSIAYIPQDVFLINDTIENNIRFFDEGISSSEIRKAAKKADVYEMIQKLPEKFNTIVGERGIRLSAGQRQRITIARVLTRNPQILLLDEATSALDTESEKAIKKVIKGLRGSMTVCMIAHQASTLSDVDIVFVLEDGQITEKGAPNRLSKNLEGYFSKMQQNHQTATSRTMPKPPVAG